ncbi:MAG: hypothetical protein GVY29_13045 [Spirochaetes bacterium]|jgi:hypothetical protein|nr:hypothetical protein [Spirochaetota bacterium]
MKHTFYRLLLTLVERGRLPLPQWEALVPAAMLNNEPFHQLVSVTNDEVALDQDRLLSHAQGDLYDWHFDVVRAVREGSIW